MGEEECITKRPGGQLYIINIFLGDLLLSEMVMIQIQQHERAVI